MNLLSDREFVVLRAACDTFAPMIDERPDPTGFWARSASDMRVAEAIEEILAGLPQREQRELHQLLSLLGSRSLGVTWRGPLRSIDRLAPDQREQVFRCWFTHFVPQLRKGAATLKKLTGLLFYGLATKEAPNPNWEAIGYPGPLPAPDSGSSASLRVVRPAGDVTLSCDTVIVGSGAGGGVIAGELAASGEDVIVLEKGPYVSRDEFDGLELRAMQRMYERQGSLATTDGGVSILAGSCLGGGTTINWAGAFRTPDDVLRQWAEQHGLPHLLSTDFQRSMDEVERALCVGRDRGEHNPQNQALAEGCAALGLPAKVIPRNTKPPRSDQEWRSLGFSPFGDQFGLKQGMVETYLQTAAEHGARLLAGASVRRVTIAAGRASGVEATYRTKSGQEHNVTVRARRVVVAAGAIHTPALLARSGLQHEHLGRHLYLHPTVAVAGRYADHMDPWHGPMMSVLCDAFGRIDSGYGFRLETPPTHPGILGLALPWESGRQHKEAMLHARHVAAFIVLTRDRDGGAVEVDKEGLPVLKYRLSAYDRQHTLRGIIEAIRIHLAAGAESVPVPHYSGATIANDADGRRMLQKLPRLRWCPNSFPLFSAHQMGTCRMGGDASRHPVAPDGAFRGVDGLFVADGSLFPSSSGANPMLSIQALAHHIAQGLKTGSGGGGRGQPHASRLQREGPPARGL